MPRRQARSSKPLQPNEAFRLLRDGHRKLKISGKLSTSETISVKNAVEVLESPQKSSKRNKYRLFLCDLLTECDSEQVLLCAAILEQAKVVDMRKQSRSELRGMIQSHEESSDLFLQPLASSYRIPNCKGGKHGTPFWLAFIYDS